MIQFEPRYCLFHPKVLATSYSGHIHIRCPIGDETLTVGLCKACRKWEEKYRDQVDELPYIEKGCEGCYGNKR